MTHQSSIDGSMEYAQTLFLEFIDNGGHCYAKVSHELLYRILGREGRLKEISRFSGMDAKYVYLEEDMDLGTFINAANDKGYQVRLNDSYKPLFRTTHNYKPERVTTPWGKPQDEPSKPQGRQTDLFERDLFSEI